MPDRHFELPAHPDLGYYRKQAKHLQRSYETGDAAARARAADVLGDRAAERFLLSDAQFVLAQEHGFRNWAEFRADIESQSSIGDRPVARLWGAPGSYASWADACSLTCAAATRARCNGCGPMCPGTPLSWTPPPPSFATRGWSSPGSSASRPGGSSWRPPRNPSAMPTSARRTGGACARRPKPCWPATPAAARLTAGQADTLLQMLAMRELLGAKLGEGLGVPRRRRYADRQGH